MEPRQKITCLIKQTDEGKAWYLKCLIMSIPLQIPTRPNTMMDSLRERSMERREKQGWMVTERCSYLVTKKHMGTLLLQWCNPLSQVHWGI